MNDEGTISPERAHDLREEYEQVYEQPDPRAYFRILHGLDYRLPELASPLFRNVIDTISETRTARLRVLDVGCGFGVNAALLRYPIDIDRLAHRCRDLDTGELSTDRLIQLDTNYFASWPRQVDLDYVGYDVSPQPLRYATAVNLIDDGFSSDLEATELTQSQRAILNQVDLIVSTGCAGYMTEATFTKLFDAIEVLPWLAIFALRTEPFDALRLYFEARGLAVEKLEGVTFIQRRFHSSSEWTQALMLLETQGVVADGKEADGLMHSEFYLIRPETECREHPLETIVSVSSGTEGTFGGWRGRPWGT
ncbi:MAG: class I SAM-dependent methyltransferase [Hyphomicrobiaceae bacterium]